MFAARCCRQWDRVTDRFAAEAFNASLSVPALEIFGDGVSVSDYSNRLCPAGEGFPSTYGRRDCGMVPGQVGLLVGNTAAPVSYQIFHLFSATYFLGGPRPGLPRALNDTFGVPSYPRNTVSANSAGCHVLPPTQCLSCAVQCVSVRRIHGAQQCRRAGHPVPRLGRLLQDGRRTVLARTL